MSASLLAYRLLTTALSPLMGLALNARVRKGKERADRLPERYGRSQIARPDAPLIWMHGASVGETAMLLSLLTRLQADNPALQAVITSQTLTSADMIAARAPAGVIHQMAPMDTPAAARRFLDHWRPDAGVFAEGEIWPNLLKTAKKTRIPLALINARMTQKSIKGWTRRSAAAREVFDAFSFIGAADPQTADGLSGILGKPIATVGNLKRAIDAPAAPESELAQWRARLEGRTVLLAASTHAGEETLAIDAYAHVRGLGGDPLLIIAPRHPERAPEISHAINTSGLAFKQRSTDLSAGCGAPILLADTIGEMGLWMHLADAIYLGGANAPGVGGHNPIEPLKLEKPLFTGPDTFNFADLMAALDPFNAVTTGDSADALAAFWKPVVHGGTMIAPNWSGVHAAFAEVDQPLKATLSAIHSYLNKDAPHA